eukprot:TRINITY_DN1150_c0_g1_i3.p1 TRINITY_DN1150_c0_g1~~TRINITY_DN1150_c0_g1_i3.p1  ORF type:complete len:121 (+),score=27.29 TRINITY_DN1150_c0_g1_i3:118-480(+)
MKCFAQTLELKDDPKLIAEYVEYRKQVWPEVLQAIRSMGIQEMKIFLHGNRLFMYAEADDEFDPTKDYQKYTANPRACEWDTLMRMYEQKVPAAAEDPEEWWSEMMLCFDLAAQITHTRN